MTRTFHLTGRSWTAQRVFAVSLGFLLIIDGFFIGAHVLPSALGETSYHGFLLDNRWSVQVDRSFSEYFQYFQEGLAAVALAVLFIRRKSLTYLGWMLAFSFVLIDDSFSLHEHFGRMVIARAAPTVLGVEPRLYGESLLWGLVGLVLSVFLVLGYRIDPRTRPFSRRLLYSLVALSFFGGLVDALHRLVNSESRVLTFLIGTLEDGGELVVMSVALALVVAYFTSQAQLPTKNR